MFEEAKVVVPADPASPEAAPTLTPPTAAEVWEKTVSKAPITTEDVKGDEPTEEKKERVLVAPEIVKALAEKTPVIPDALSDRLSAIEALLAPKTDAEPTTIEAEVADLKDIILSQQAEATKATEDAADKSRWDLLRDGVISNIRAEKERFPLLIGLHQEENVYHELRLQLSEGKTVSEDDVASKAEAKLQAAFDAMKLAQGVIDAPPSKDPEQSETTPTPTLSPSLSSGDAPVNVDAIIAETGDRRQAAAELWDSLLKE